ncbi:MAG: histidinol-phosphatase [Lentisphaeria bacterium]|nr:histidinol-phosphatase [Lentisphaeria bacterium]
MNDPVSIPRVNLHTHTFRCKHASGTVNDYCRKALDAGIAILGFSDHCPFPDQEYSNSRMNFTDLPDYLRDIDIARCQYPQLTILSGLELDYRPILGKQFYLDEIIDKYHLDYTIAGAHFLPAANGKRSLYVARENPLSLPTLRAFVHETVRVMETGLADYLAHPDLTALGIASWTPEIRSAYLEIVDAAADLHIPLEINAYGLRKPWIETPEGKRPPYPWIHFWELAAEHGGIEVVAGSDAHRPEDVWGNLDDAFAMADRLGFPVRNYELAQRIIARRDAALTGCPRIEKSPFYCKKSVSEIK